MRSVVVFNACFLAALAAWAFLATGEVSGGDGPGSRVAKLERRGVIDYKQAEKFDPAWADGVGSGEIARYFASNYMYSLVTIAVFAAAGAVVNVAALIISTSKQPQRPQPQQV